MLELSTVKYIVAPSKTIGKYWKDMFMYAGLKVEDRPTIITSEQDLHSINKNLISYKNTIIICGPLFDNPELNIGPDKYNEYMRLVDYVKHLTYRSDDNILDIGDIKLMLVPSQIVFKYVASRFKNAEKTMQLPEIAFTFKDAKHMAVELNIPKNKIYFIGDKSNILQFLNWGVTTRTRSDYKTEVMRFEHFLKKITYTLKHDTWYGTEGLQIISDENGYYKRKDDKPFITSIIKFSNGLLDKLIIDVKKDCK